MKAVIPVAKKKEGLFPFSETKPTGLIPVMGKPLVKHLINELQSVGVDDIFLVTNYLQEEFEDEFGEYTNVNIVHQESLTGTAEAIRTCNFIEEDFFVVNGDVIVSSNDLQSLLQKHENSKGSMTLLATEQNKPEKFGVLSITDDRIEAIEEKPEEAENPLVNTGLYIFRPRIFDYLEKLDEDETSITDAVSRMIEQREEARIEFIQDYWIDIDSPKKLLKADKVRREHEINSAEVHESADISDKAEIGEKVIIEKNVKVRPGAVIEDYSYIAENSIIGPGTVIENSSIGYNCQINSGRVQSSVIFEKNILDSGTFLENIVLGEESDVKSGSVVRESFIGPRSFIEMNNSILGVKFVPDARTDLGEISK